MKRTENILLKNHYSLKRYVNDTLIGVYW